MIYTEKTYTRPNTNIPWHGELLTTPEHRAHVDSTYIFTGKILTKEKILSEDGLSITFKYTFDAQESLDQYEADPVMVAYWQSRTDYNSAMGITESTKTVTS